MYARLLYQITSSSNSSTCTRKILQKIIEYKYYNQTALFILMRMMTHLNNFVYIQLEATRHEKIINYFCFSQMSDQMTLAVVYSLGNLKLCTPMAFTRGRFPAFGMTFQASDRVTFWWFLKKQNTHLFWTIFTTFIPSWIP